MKGARWGVLAVLLLAWPVGSAGVAATERAGIAAWQVISPPAPPPAGLRVPPWRPPTRQGVAPTPVALGAAPEATAPGTARAALDRARADGSNVALVIDGPEDDAVVAGY